MLGSYRAERNVIMRKFVRKNGTVEYFTDNKDKILELMYDLDDIGRGAFACWRGKFLVQVSLDEATDAVDNGEDVMVEDIEAVNVVYYYGKKMWNHCEGFRIDLLTEENRQRADKDGIEYIV